VDIGFKSSSISILLNGELTSAASWNWGRQAHGRFGRGVEYQYAEAEGIKIGMPEQVQSTMLRC